MLWYILLSLLSFMLGGVAVWLYFFKYQAVRRTDTLQQRDLELLQARHEEVLQEVRQAIDRAFSNQNMIREVSRIVREALFRQKANQNLDRMVRAALSRQEMLDGVTRVVHQALARPAVLDRISRTAQQALSEQKVIQEVGTVVREVLSQYTVAHQKIPLDSHSEPETPSGAGLQELEDLKSRYQSILSAVSHIDQVIYEVISKSAIVNKQVQSFTSRISQDTETAVFNFMELLRNLNVASIQATTDIVEEIKAKMALTVEQSQSASPKSLHAPEYQDLKQIQIRYQTMLNEVMTQFNLTVQRKAEDIGKLDHIREGVGLMRPFSQEIAQIASSTKIIAVNAAIEAAHAGEHGRTFTVVATEVRSLADKAMASATNVDGELKRLTTYIEQAIDEIKTAMAVESSFVNSTITLLQDVVLSVVTSFIKLSEIVQQNLADSAKFRDDVNSIVVNLQFEDICNQMSQHTLKIVESIQQDLKQIRLDAILGDTSRRREDTSHEILSRIGGLFTMAEEVRNAREALNLDMPAAGAEAQVDRKADSDDEVLFFDEAPPEDEAQAGPETDEVVFFDEVEQPEAEGPAKHGDGDDDNDDDEVTFFDEVAETGEPAKPEAVPEKPKKAEAVKPPASGSQKQDKPAKFDDDEDVTFF